MFNLTSLSSINDLKRIPAVEMRQLLRLRRKFYVSLRKKGLEISVSIFLILNRYFHFTYVMYILMPAKIIIREITFYFFCFKL